MHQRIKKINYMHRWENFRQNKEIIFARYIKAKKIHNICRGFLEILYKYKSIKHIWDVFDEKRTHTAAKMKLITFLKRNIKKKMI